MSLESASWAPQLSAANPQSTDPRSQGDDHLRMIKNVIKNELSPDNRQWVYTGDAVTRASGTAFTAEGDLRTTYADFRRVRVVGSSTGTIYGTVTSATYSANTAVNIAFFNAGTMANEALAVYVAALTDKSVPFYAPTMPIVTYPIAGTHFFVSDDCGKLHHLNASASTFTLPDSTDNSVAVGQGMDLSTSSGAITLTAGPGATLYFFNGSGGTTGSRTIAQGGYATLMKFTATSWIVRGTGIT